MKHLRRALSLTLALALALSLSVVSASAAELTYDNATSFIDVQVNTDVDTEVFIDEADAVDYYNPYWRQTSSNTGYFAFERDSTITVTYLPGVGYTGNEISEPFVWVALFPYRQQADGSYVSTLGEDEYGNAVPYILSVDGTFQPVEVSTLAPWSYSIYDTGTLRGLNPGESVTFTLPFDEMGDDLLYEVQAVLSFNWQEDPMSGWIVSNDSWKYVRAMLDEAAVAQMRAEQAGQTETVAGFTDVPASAWYASYVQTVVDKDLFAGVGEGTFAPESSMTYAQFLTVLYKFSGDQLPASQGAWYQGYVDWAENAGLVPAEIADFNPDAAITRQDMAALFGNFLNAYEHPGQSPTSQEPAFHDAGSIAGYAADGVTLCYQMGLMSGKDGNLFDPLATATRAEVAVTMTQMARVMGR